ncbi:MAG TPA: N-acetylneuraminate synthase family protein [Gemmatimonadaceae bacterium]|nr:N-acetylneuraminate synthase family protein [Gemmatimonadaceae bacterium]
MTPPPLFILEMANNHMGDVEHGLALIRAMHEAVRGFDAFQFAFKLQYRDLDTYIHPSARGRSDVKYVKRFEETRLSADQFQRLIDEMRRWGFRTACTPFDEASVALLERQGIEILKIASAALTDWPLLERIAKVEKPIVASTAGASLAEMDAVVSFFLHRRRALTLMHCVAEYPTPDADLKLSQLDVLRGRYPEVRLGFSTHEAPGETAPVMLAVAKGATVFEKHVALETAKYKPNAYSATPEQVRAWVTAAARALAMCGPAERLEPPDAERESLHSLRRGVYAARAIKAGVTLGAADVVIAFPPVSGQLTANERSKYVSHRALRDIAAGAPILRADVETKNHRDAVLRAVQAVKELLRQGNIVVPGKAELELSHHYGVERFEDTGLTMITVVNREYCKKLLAMLPGQTHPEQYHEEKEETFVVQHGTMRLWLDGVPRDCGPGDVITVARGVRHRFHTETGVVFEEISSTHLTDDSYYTDPAIAENRNRKTFLAYWM